MSTKKKPANPIAEQNQTAAQGAALTSPAAGTMLPPYATWDQATNSIRLNARQYRRGLELTIERENLARREEQFFSDVFSECGLPAPAGRGAYRMGEDGFTIQLTHKPAARPVGSAGSGGGGGGVQPKAKTASA